MDIATASKRPAACCSKETFLQYQRPEVERVLHPALPSHPGHALWKRDFTGASGLFSFVLKPGTPKKAIDSMLVGMGLPWGGFESLMMPVFPTALRTAVPWQAGPTLRVHAGLEDLDDLIADLDAGFKRLIVGGRHADAA